MKRKVFSVVKAVKENSRTRIGVVPTTKVLKHKNKAAAKHPKKELDEAMETE